MNKEELYKTILNSPTHKYALLNEIYAIRDKKLETEDYTIAVNGFISVDSLLDNYNLINEKQQLITWLENKIKKYENDKHNYPHLFTFYSGILGAYEEVLDFVEKGGKE